MDPGEIKLSTFVTKDRLKQVSDFVTHNLESENFTKQISTENQFLFIFPILISSLESQDDALVNRTIDIFCKWLLVKAPGANNEIRNKYLRFSLIHLKDFCSNEKYLKRIDDIANALSVVVLNPPCEYEKETWVLLMKILPIFAENGNKCKSSVVLWDLSMKVFVTSGLINDDTLKLLNERPNDNKSWQKFVGDIIVSLVIPQFSHPYYFTQGVWGVENPVPIDFLQQILDSLLNHFELTDDLRRICFFGVIDSILQSAKELIRFEYPIEDIIAPYADVIFPLERIGVENCKNLFDFFALGKLPMGSEWFSVFSSAIKVEFLRVDENDAMILLCGMIKLISKRPEFFLDLVPDLLACFQRFSKESNTTSVPKEMINEWSHLCSSINELNQCFHYDTIDTLLSILIKKVPLELSIYERFLISFSSKSYQEYKQEHNLCHDFNHPQWLLYEAFAPHFSSSLARIHLIDSRIAQFTMFPENYQYLLLLMLIESLTYAKDLRKDPKFLQRVITVCDKTQNKFSYLSGYLRNLVYTPTQYQLSYDDLEEELKKESQKIRYNGGIASASFEADGCSVLILRNKFSMNGFRMSPSQNIKNEPVILPPPTHPSSGSVNDPPIFQPFHPLDSHRSLDTFSVLASFGLFTSDNKNKLEILSNDDLSKLERYEKIMGPKNICVSVARISIKQCNSLFGAKASSPKFNNFMKQIGNFRYLRDLGSDIELSLPVPTFDTALYRFSFISQLHFQNPNEEVEKFLSDQKILIIFSEGGRVEENHKLLDGFELVINISLCSDKLYYMNVIKAPEAMQLPFIANEPRLSFAENLTNEIGFILFIYASLQVNNLFVCERIKFLNDSHLFSNNSAPTDGINFLSQLFNNA